MDDKSKHVNKTTKLPEENIREISAVLEWSKIF